VGVVPLSRGNRVRKILLDIISFGTPLTQTLNLVLILLALAILPTGYIAKYSPFHFRCIFKTVILPLIFRGNCPSSGLFAGCNCPACGMTRAMSRLLHGDLIGAWNFNPLVFVVLGIMVWIIATNVATMLKINARERRTRTPKKK